MLALGAASILLLELARVISSVTEVMVAMSSLKVVLLPALPGLTMVAPSLSMAALRPRAEVAQLLYHLVFPLAALQRVTLFLETSSS